MAVTTNRLLVWLEAQTAQFEARMTAAGTAVDRITRSQVVAARSVGQLRTGLQGLAQQAVGATGPLGQLTSGFLGLFGGAGGLALLGGMAGVVLLLKNMGEAARESAKRIDELHGQWVRLMQAAGPNVATAGALTGIGGDPGLIERQTELTRQLAAARQGRLVMDPSGQTDATRRIVDRDEVARLETELNTLNVVIALTTAKWREQHDALENADLVRRIDEAAEALGRLKVDVDLAAIPPFPITAAVPGGFAQSGITAPSGQQMRQALVDADVNSVLEQSRAIQKELQQQEASRIAILRVLGNAELQAQIAALGLSEAFLKLVTDMEAVKQATDAAKEAQAQLRAVQMINAASQLAALAVSGGGAGQFISAAGGLIGMANPIAGAIVSGLGGILSADAARREREANRRNKELIDAIREDENRPITIYIDEFTDDRQMQQRNTRERDFVSRGGRPAYALPPVSGPERGP